MSEKRLDYDLLWNNYYQVIELDDGDTDYLRRLSPTEIIKRLNEQQATNDYLEEANSRLQIQLGETLRLVDEQQATIKSKDKQLERLYNYFQDYLKDEMSGNAFSEIWDFVKEDEKWEDE